jgi:hypothetical protein
MLYPKQTNCPENGDINFLIFSIDCRLSKLANTMYNNTVFMLNKTISSTAIFDLIQYKRILFYKQINPDYVACYSVNQIASQVKKLTAGFAGSSSSFDPPATRTTTTTTSISTTTTTSSTTTTTTTLKVIGCNVSSEFSGGDFYPTTEFVILGNVIGTVVLNYNTENIPDRFIVQWNGNDVIDTGYRGPDSYDFGGAVREFFNDSLTGKTDPISGLQYPLTPGSGFPPNEISADGYPRVLAPGIGTASFYKNSTTSASATVKIYSPTDSEVYDPGDKVWLYTLTCPVPTTTTTTSSTTTTTTTLPPEPFRIQAVGITEFDAPFANPGMIITSSIAFSIDWGDGIETFIAGYHEISHSYVGTYSGPITILSTDLTQITNLEILSNPHNSPQSLSVTTAEIAKLDGLLEFTAQFPSGIFVDGLVSDLPDSLVAFTAARTNIAGTIAQIKPNLAVFNVTGSAITGDIASLETGIGTTTFAIRGNNNGITGNVVDLPRSTQSCAIVSTNPISNLSGTTADLPDPTNLLLIAVNNTISGDVANLSKAGQVEIYGQNIISGNISGFTTGNTSTTFLVIQGINEVTGSISDFTSLSTLRRLEITGDSSFSGNLSSLPSSLQFVNLVPSLIGASGNTFSGSVSTLPAALEILRVSSVGTFTGDLISLPANIIELNAGMNLDLTYNLVTPRTWATGVYCIATPQTTNTGWAGFTKDETDKLILEIAPRYTQVVNILRNRFQIKCGPAPKRSTNLPPPPPPVLPPPTPTPEGTAVDAAVATIEAGLGSSITLY